MVTFLDQCHELNKLAKLFANSVCKFVFLFVSTHQFKLSIPEVSISNTFIATTAQLIQFLPLFCTENDYMALRICSNWLWVLINCWSQYWEFLIYLCPYNQPCHILIRTLKILVRKHKEFLKFWTLDFQNNFLFCYLDHQFVWWNYEFIKERSCNCWRS